VPIRVFGRGGLNGELSSDISENSLPEVSTEHVGLPLWLEGERDQAHVYYDYQIDNSGDLELLERKLDLVLAALEKQYIVE
jgi:hypothetical protein